MAKQASRETAFAVETTLAGNTPLQLMQNATTVGYKITLLYIELASAFLTASSVIARVKRGGHLVPLEYIEHWYPDTVSKITYSNQDNRRSRCIRQQKSDDSPLA